MTVTQLSLFVENRRGAVRGAVDVLAGAGVDIATLSLADTSEFGILRLVVKDPGRAKEALVAAGYVVNVAEVLPVEVDDRAGGLAAVLDRIDQAGVAVEYLYAFAVPPKKGKAVLILRFADGPQARKALDAAGAKVLTAEELFAGR
jgi:hypothetical protein